MIRDEIAALLARAEHRPEELPALVHRHDALPLLLDSGGFVGIRPSGELVMIAWDQGERAEKVSDPGTRHLALSQGARRFPRLEFLRPQRTSTSRGCTECEGDGRIRIDGTLMPEGILCRCGGLGWVP